MPIHELRSNRNSSRPGSSSDPLISGYRIRGMTDLMLPSGFWGSVVVKGYNAAEQFYNSGGGSGASDMGDGNGLITFTGSGRYGSAGAYPDQHDVGTPDRYLAGNFAFQIPEPSAVALLASGVLLLARPRRLCKPQP